MTRIELIDWARSKGWTLDIYRHLKKEKNNRKYRIKLQRISARYEVKCFDRWVRICSGYYKDLTLNEKNQLLWMQ